VMHHGECMVRLTRLPPSKHVLTLSTPLLPKNKDKLRASDYFYFGLTGIVYLH
jgi:hypothetical protein